ncbi:MAG: hypothetical protein NVS1B7_7820 [Candidatus Saccharimonadales bacterium]
MNTSQITKDALHNAVDIMAFITIGICLYYFLLGYVVALPANNQTAQSLPTAVLPVEHKSAPTAPKVESF